MALKEEDVQVQLSRRRPGQSNLTTPVSRVKSPELSRTCERKSDPRFLLFCYSAMRKTE